MDFLAAADTVGLAVTVVIVGFRVLADFLATIQVALVTLAIQASAGTADKVVLAVTQDQALVVIQVQVFLGFQAIQEPAGFQELAVLAA